MTVDQCFIQIKKQNKNNISDINIAGVKTKIDVLLKIVV